MSRYKVSFFNTFFRAHIERIKAIENGKRIEDNCILSVDDNPSVDEDVENIYGIVTEALTAIALSSFLLPYFV